MENLEEKKQISAEENKQIPHEIVDMILENQAVQVEERMGLLHNRFVAFIAEAQIPIPEVVTLLHVLLAEATEMALKKYIGGNG